MKLMGCQSEVADFSFSFLISCFLSEFHRTEWLLGGVLQQPRWVPHQSYVLIFCVKVKALCNVVLLVVLAHNSLLQSCCKNRGDYRSRGGLNDVIESQVPLLASSQPLPSDFAVLTMGSMFYSVCSRWELAQGPFSSHCSRIRTDT